MKNKLYFAYGSNLNDKQILNRCPSTKFITNGILENYSLVDKNSPLYKGFVTIEKKKNSVVKGKVYQLSNEDIKMLDMYEGHPFVYKRITTKIKTNKNYINCECYMIGDLDLDF